MAPEVPAVSDVEVGYVYQDHVLKVKSKLGAARVSIRLDWAGDGNPGTDLDVLLSSLPHILIMVHQNIDNEEAPRA